MAVPKSVSSQVHRRPDTLRSLLYYTSIRYDGRESLGKGSTISIKELIIRGTWNYTRGIMCALCRSTFYRFILAHFSNAYSTSVSKLRAWLTTWNKGLYRRLVTLSCMGDPMDKRTRSLYAHRKSHCICLADQSTRAFADGLPARVAYC